MHTRILNSNRYSTFLLLLSNSLAAVISVRASNRHLLLFSLDLFSPDFDDTSVPTEPNDEFGSGNDSEEPLVSVGETSVQEIIKFAGN